MARSTHKKYEIPKNPDRIQITEDDEEILLEVFRHEVIDSKGVFGLFPGRSEKVLRERLRKLCHNGYLHRLDELEQTFRPGGGSFPIPYVLGAKGAERLKPLGVKPQRAKRGYKERASKVKLPFVKHSLEISRLLLRVRGACASVENFEFLYPHEIYKRFAPNILDRSKLPRRLQTSVKNWHQHKPPVFPVSAYWTDWFDCLRE